MLGGVKSRMRVLPKPGHYRKKKKKTTIQISFSFSRAEMRGRVNNGNIRDFESAANACERRGRKISALPEAVEPRMEAKRGFSSSKTVSAVVLNTPYSSATHRMRILPTLKLFTSSSSSTVVVDRTGGSSPAGAVAKAPDASGDDDGAAGAGSSVSQLTGDSRP
ncbi:Hypothetical protein CINCED_3A003410 [Cinara cedri]|uniref:Uncharacterized protein n=1 Tax=Cinara cedri TaxID=506608 RepID=A0A5E4N371_9HEMI|nr:Hypothetical protein CINCED_3A003410 [Cinara cedri]